MTALGQHNFPVPVAIENNRHAVLMSLVDAFPLVQVYLRHYIPAALHFKSATLPRMSCFDGNSAVIL